MAGRRSRPVEAELGLERDQVGFRMVSLLPALGERSVRAVDKDRPAERAASGLVLDGQGVVDWPGLARIAGRAAKQVRFRIMGAEIGLPFELATALAAGLEDDVGDLPGLAGDAQRGGIDNLDP